MTILIHLMKEVLPGIYQITLTMSGFPPGFVNAYLIQENNGYLIIDTGWDTPPSLLSLEKQMSEIGASLHDIKRALITHAHIDHLGLTPRLKKSYRVKVYLHHNEMDLIRFRYSHGDQFLSSMDNFLLKYGFPEPELTPPEIRTPPSDNLSSLSPDVLFQGGEEISAGEFTLRVINTPGHTPGHVSFFEPERKILFSGDTLLPTIATNAALHIQHFPDSLEQYLKTLPTLKKMDVTSVLPGHGDAFSNHRQRIDELVKHHQQRTREILSALVEGIPKTAYEVSRIISWSPRTGAAAWNNLSSLDKRFAVLQTIAYLEILVRGNTLTGFSKDGKLYYRYVGPHPT
jgi:glyoxylase-like metal-dependent hydrolase (beta-lactamase superfamily II)